MMRIDHLQYQVDQEDKPNYRMAPYFPSSAKSGNKRFNEFDMMSEDNLNRYSKHFRAGDETKMLKVTVVDFKQLAHDQLSAILAQREADGLSLEIESVDVTFKDYAYVVERVILQPITRGVSSFKVLKDIVLQDDIDAYSEIVFKLVVNEENLEEVSGMLSTEIGNLEVDLDLLQRDWCALEKKVAKLTELQMFLSNQVFGEMNLAQKISEMELEVDYSEWQQVGMDWNLPDGDLMGFEENKKADIDEKMEPTANERKIEMIDYKKALELLDEEMKEEFDQPIFLNSRTIQSFKVNFKPFKRSVPQDEVIRKRRTTQNYTDLYSRKKPRPDYFQNSWNLDLIDH